jgi:hypothetical protein
LSGGGGGATLGGGGGFVEGIYEAVLINSLLFFSN